MKTVTTKRYAVEWVGVGYYAEVQPYYYWSFTPDIFDSRLFKTPKKAQKFGEDGQCIQSSPTFETSFRIVPVLETIAYEHCEHAESAFFEFETWEQKKAKRQPPEVITMAAIKNADKKAAYEEQA